MYIYFNLLLNFHLISPFLLQFATLFSYSISECSVLLSIREAGGSFFNFNQMNFIYFMICLSLLYYCFTHDTVTFQTVVLSLNNFTHFKDEIDLKLYFLFLSIEVLKQAELAFHFIICIVETPINPRILV